MKKQKGLSIVIVYNTYILFRLFSSIDICKGKAGSFKDKHNEEEK